MEESIQSIPVFIPPLLLAFALAAGSFAMIKLVATSMPKAKEMEEWRDEPPLIFKLFKPLVLLFSNEVRTMMSDKLYETMHKKLSAAGMNYAIMPEEHLTLKYVCFLVAVAICGLVYYSNPAMEPRTLLILGAIVFFGFFYPDMWLSDRITNRRRQVAKDFPFLLDLLVLSMKAGLNYSSSLGQAIASLPEGPVRDEFAKLLREIRAGKSRRQALLDLGERMNIPSVHNFVAAMNQAEETGGEIVDVLTQQANQRRNERFNKAEEVANKAPVRMLLPMMAFLFPILFMLIAFIIVVKLGEMGMLSDSMMKLLMS